MGKELSEMTREELWELFPIFLTEHKDCWIEYYKEMEERLHSGLSGIQLVRISHILEVRRSAIYGQKTLLISWLRLLTQKTLKPPQSLLKKWDS